MIEDRDHAHCTSAILLNAHYTITRGRAAASGCHLAGGGGLGGGFFLKKNLRGVEARTAYTTNARRGAGMVKLISTGTAAAAADVTA